MTNDAVRSFTLPRDGDRGCREIANKAGLTVSVLPNGCLFALEHVSERGRIMLNQVPGSPIAGGIGRLCVRIEDGRLIELVGPGAKVRFGAAADRLVWEGEAESLRHRTTLWLAPDRPVWLWQIEVTNTGKSRLAGEALLIQDLGLGDRGFISNNEAYVSQYIDHHIEPEPALGPVIMSRQNLAQLGGRFPLDHARLLGRRRGLRHRCAPNLRAGLPRPRQPRLSGRQEPAEPSAAA
ncbi:hypothetical protein [Nordella sp. HKS 07]|uniref:hypothetical protein n=1 Tax=Nordella sp. HKS 07 TaxID=2712222 RepID=UPI001FEFBF1A|nr:hypothetical protein [Nordella sp. HKS 07]